MFTWPEFTQKLALGDGRGWTAAFDSYDQRNEDCYYVVTLSDDLRPQAPFMVKVGLDFVVGDDFTSPAFLDELRNRIAQVAATGQTNTDYKGSVLRS